MYARVGLKGGGRMKHQKEWRTCDRCGKEIKVGLLAVNSITRNAVIDEIDKWYEDSWKSMYKCEPIEVTKEKIKIISDGKTAQIFIDGKKVRCTDMELHFIGHSNQSPMIKVNARCHKTDENGNTILNEDKTAILTEGIKINC